MLKTLLGLFGKAWLNFTHDIGGTGVNGNLLVRKNFTDVDTEFYSNGAGTTNGDMFFSCDLCSERLVCLLGLFSR
jgi:hypothetical protein